MAQLMALLDSAIAFGTVIMLGALGEIIIEKSGNLNLGIPGVMFLGAIGGLIPPFFYELGGGSNPIVGILLSLLCSLLFSAFGGIIYAFLTITLRANQNVTGLTLTIFGAGFAEFFGASLNKLAGGVGQISIPVTSAGFRAYTPLGSMGGIMKILFGHGFLVYLALVLAVVLHWFLNHTRKGLNLRAVGENPGTADAAGINVTRYKYVGTIVGSAIAGLGGLFYTVDYIKGTWANDGTVEGLGWLAVALVIFATWKPLNAIWGSYLFGIVMWSYMYVPGLTRSTSELYKMLPYVMTLVVLILVSLRKKRENQPPASLGLSYFREER
ncbi:MAG: ABC transporter permease [Oscillospiraceae bacterium]|nr:ABC transporter permease [Oscillospiraceae bacterium]